jgi:hypothetical protein
MTFAPPDVSRVATRQIGVANAVLWILGSIILLIVGATAAYSFVIAPYTGGAFYGNDQNPWEVAQPVVATEDDGVWSAEASGVIRIPAEEFTYALGLTVEAGGEVILYRTDPSLGITSTDEYFYPEYLGYTTPDDLRVIVPTGDDLELWVEAGQAWQVRLAPLTATIMSDEGANGTGNAYLIYTGDAVSARFIYAGDGIFFVSVYTAFTDDTPIITTGDTNERLSWEPDSYVVFEIEADVGEGAWVIDIDELARPDSTTTPTPTPTPTPTETP